MRVILFSLLLTATTVSQAASNYVFSNPQGQYGVGLHVVQQYDYSRTFKGKLDLVSGQAVTGEKARPIQALIWYPARKEGKPIIYADYMQSAATETNFDNHDPDVISRKAEMRAGVGHTGSKESIEAEANQPMWAVRDAAPVSGKFPVVIYAPSFNASAHENADMCEYLASSGYVVIASPDMGARARGMTVDLEGIETQAGDIEFLIGYAHSLAQADMSQIAVVGYSWGGISNVFAAAKDSRIKAIVSLDGSVRYYPELVKDSTYVTPARLALPFLFVAAQPRSLEELNKRKDNVSANFINQMVYSDVYKITMYPMIHPNFSADDLRFAQDADFTEYSRAEVSQAHGWMVRYVQQFLNAYLKGDAAGLAFINNRPSNNGVPAHMITLDVHHAEGPAPTMETFVGDLARRGFEHVNDAYQEMHKRDAAFVLAEQDVNSWGYELMRTGKSKEAIEVFKLGTILYPQSGNTFDSLAEAYEKTNDKPLAIKNYQQSLVLDPKNGNAVIHLKSLGAP